MFPASGSFPRGILHHHSRCTLLLPRPAQRFTTTRKGKNTSLLPFHPSSQRLLHTCPLTTTTTTTTMSPFLKRGILRRKDPTTDPPSPQKPLSTPPSRNSSPASPHSLPSPSPSASKASIPNTDPLPTSAHALEGLLNSRSSQLQKLADRVESVNEWLEMDGIVLAKLIHDISAQVEKEEAAERASREAAERARALWKENNPTVPAASIAPVSPGQYRGVNAGSSRVSSGSGGHSRVPSGESRVPEVFLKGLNLAGKSREERINESCSVRDLRERIKGMKQWRRELERTVY